jgi:hypothetical protein
VTSPPDVANTVDRTGGAAVKYLPGNLGTVADAGDDNIRNTRPKTAVRRTFPATDATPFRRAYYDVSARDE